MDVQERQTVLQLEHFSRQLFVVLRQHGGKLIHRGGEHADQCRQDDKHHHDDNRDGHGPSDATANKPGHQRIQHNREKESQQKLNDDVCCRVNTGEDHDQTGEF